MTVPTSNQKPRPPASSRVWNDRGGCSFCTVRGCNDSDVTTFCLETLGHRGKKQQVILFIGWKNPRNSFSGRSFPDPANGPNGGLKSWDAEKRSFYKSGSSSPFDCYSTIFSHVTIYSRIRQAETVMAKITYVHSIPRGQTWLSARPQTGGSGQATRSTTVCSGFPGSWLAGDRSPSWHWVSGIAWNNCNSYLALDW